MTDIKTTSVATFNVRHLQFMNENSELAQPLPDFATDDTLLRLYRHMSLTRVFDNKAVNLQRTGQMSTYPSSRGQEAIFVGIGHALQPTDIHCPYYRDQGTLLMRGVSMAEIFSFWGGDERGAAYANPAVAEDFPMCVPIAGQSLHAVGVAYAVKYRRQARAVLTTCGDGATSKGDFYEALNLAGTWKLPVVFVVNNNQWAISINRDAQSGAQTLAQKAFAAGMEGIQVDGNDVIAVRQAAADALHKARTGGGPTLIEALTYRLCDHTTADDAKRYQPAEDVKAAWKLEPLLRLGRFLEAKGLWSRDHEAQLLEELTKEVETGVQEYLVRPAQPVTAIFDNLYAHLPQSLLAQRASAEEFHHG
jgi:pyruvate dehydrogenase E1 component alpha subunit